MPRRKKSSFKREISGDPVYQSELVQKFINVIMWRGKKNVARSIVYGAFEILGKKVGADKDKTLDLFHKAFMNIVPLVEVRSRRVGGSVYQIPMEVRKDRGDALGLRWLVKAASSRPAKTMAQRLAQEIIEASEGRGGAVGEKINREKMARANRAFSHFAW
jgi:small subunit ribosomal protein S7